MKAIKAKLKNLSKDLKDRLIYCAWQDQISFDEIKKKYDFSEAEIIELMRKELKRSSFKLWRKRVNNKLSKHGKVSKTLKEKHKSVTYSSQDLYEINESL